VHPDVGVGFTHLPMSRLDVIHPTFPLMVVSSCYRESSFFAMFDLVSLIYATLIAAPKVESWQRCDGSEVRSETPLGIYLARSLD